MRRAVSRHPASAGDRFFTARAAPRYPIRSLAELVEPMTRRVVNGWTSSVSEIGCHVSASDGMAVGAIVKLRIKADEQWFETWARVANAVPNEGMGMTFLDTSEAQREFLRKSIENFIASQATESSQNSI